MVPHSVTMNGRVNSAEVKEESIVLKCQLAAQIMKTPALPRRYQRMCPHALYGEGCGANEYGFDVSNLEVTAISSDGKTITLGGHSFSEAADYYVAGKVLVPRLLACRMVIAQDNALKTLTLTSGIRMLEQGDKVSIYAGCDHTFSTCKAKFSNHLNYGGQPWIPEKNPFESSIG